MKIYLIRHGETTGDLEDRYGGAYDDHLTEAGELQAIELGRKLQDKHISCIYHSPKMRAVETANILAQIIAVETILIQDLQERNAYGVFTWMIKSEAEKLYPEEIEKVKKDKLYHDVKDSEDYPSFKTRVLTSFENILNDKQHESVALVSHGGYIGCVMREVFSRWEFLYLGDCGVIEIEKKDDIVTVISLDNAKLEE
jgi:broad specificity phosphatase PhoE